MKTNKTCHLEKKHFVCKKNFFCQEKKQFVYKENKIVFGAKKSKFFEIFCRTTSTFRLENTSMAPKKILYKKMNKP